MELREKQMNVQYVYMIKTREFIRTNENIFKIGRTEQLNYGRFNSYDKGSVLLFQSICENCRDCEKNIIKKFKEKFIHRIDFGNEYFEGDCNEMINIISNIVLHKNVNFVEDELLSLREMYTKDVNELKIKCNELENNLKFQMNNFKNELLSLHEIYTKNIDELKKKCDELKNNLNFKITEIDKLETKCHRLENKLKFQIGIINKLIKNDCDKYLKYDELSKNLNIDWKIIKKNLDKPWNYRYLSKNHNITWEIVRKNRNISWDYRFLSENHNITWEIVKENVDKPWSYLGLSANPNITLEIANSNPNNPWDYKMLKYPREIIMKMTNDCFELVYYDNIELKYLNELKSYFNKNLK